MKVEVEKLCPASTPGRPFHGPFVGPSSSFKPVKNRVPFATPFSSGFFLAKERNRRDVRWRVLQGVVGLWVGVGG